MTVRVPGDLDAAAILAVAEGASLRLSDELLAGLSRSREETLTALATSGPVYGVTTGMGRAADLAVGAAEQPAFQGDLMLARAVGTAPWTDRRGVRATVAARVRMLLAPEAGASPDLVCALVALLDADVLPALPVTGYGAAGEIIVMAHLGGFLSGRGEGLDADGRLVPADTLLRGAGLAPYAFGAKEGVAFLEGVPAATAQSVLLAADARLLAGQALVTAAAEIALVRAPRDPYHPALARGDDELATVLAALRGLAGDEPEPRMLQAPLSFRVVGPALAHLLRTLDGLDAAVERSLVGVSTSPALVGGRFIGTTGFDGFDLAASADAVRLGVLHVAEVATARLHRLLDPRVTGLAPQLSAEPGRQAGVVALHKRAAGVVHAALRRSAPMSLGATETSLGQEDVQSFALDATAAAHDSLAALRDVTACEIVALHQARMLDEGPGWGSESLRLLLHKASETLPKTSRDRGFGPEVMLKVNELALGWAHGTLGPTPGAPSRPPHPTG